MPAQRCSKCRRELLLGASFCVACGTALPKKARIPTSHVVGKCCLCGRELRSREVKYANWLAADPFCTGCLSKFQQAKKELPGKSHGEILITLRKNRAEAREKAQKEARRKAEQERIRAVEEASERAEQEARGKVEQEAREKAEQEAYEKAHPEVQEARDKAEQDARDKAEQDARDKAEQDARDRAEETARREAEEQARMTREEAVRRNAEHERAKAEKAARKKAEEEAKARAAKERADKIALLEEKVASEPNKWVPHFALAEFLEKLWYAYMNATTELYFEKEATEEYQQYKKRARESYFKAISLGIDKAYYSACAKLAYALLLVPQGSLDGFLRVCAEYAHIGPLQEFGYNADSDWTRHYAREAEKDLRKRLQKYPDDISALRKLAQAVALHQVSDRVRTDRLTAIDARIAEAEMRRQMSVAPSKEVAPLGVPESPYPDNWKQLSEAAKHRDDHECTDCGASGVELHVHHIIPLSKGGTNDMDNLTTLCSMCHSIIHPRMGDG